MSRNNIRFAVTTVTRSGDAFTADTRAGTVPAEEPLEVRWGGQSLLTTTRTPGNDIELVHGWLFTEGLITSAAQVATMRYCAGAVDTGGRNTYNLMDVQSVHPIVAPAPPAPLANSCGISPEQAITEIAHRAPFAIEPLSLPAEQWYRLAGLTAETVHGDGRGAKRGEPPHAAALVGANGEDVRVRMDLRVEHSVDKLIGSLVTEDDLPAAERVLLLGSRVTFDVVRKAMMAAIPAIVTTAGVTAMAVELARHASITLVGEASTERLSVYAGEIPL